MGWCSKVFSLSKEAAVVDIGDGKHAFVGSDGQARITELDPNYAGANTFTVEELANPEKTVKGAISLASSGKGVEDLQQDVSDNWHSDGEDLASAKSALEKHVSDSCRLSLAENLGTYAEIFVDTVNASPLLDGEQKQAAITAFEQAGNVSVENLMRADASEPVVEVKPDLATLSFMD